MRSSMLLRLGGALVLLLGAAAHAEDEMQPAPAAEMEGAATEPADADEPLEATAPEAAAEPSEPAESTGQAEETEPLEAPAEAAAAPMDDTTAEMPAAADPAADDAAAAEMAVPEETALPADDLAAELPAEAAAEPPPAGPDLGPVGYDSEGREGRVHTVVIGDTLWDISDAYLGTPWVWPSIWQDNRQVENPHLIYPGDRIWITDSEMRVISAEEAEALLSGSPPMDEELPAAPGEPLEVVEDAPVPAAPTAVAPDVTSLVANREAVGLVTADVFESAASVIDSSADRVMLSQGDEVFVGLGAGDVQEGDQFTIFRKREKVFDPDTGRLLGYHVDILGWLEVTGVRDESSVARIRRSTSEIERGDRITPRRQMPDEIAVLPSPSGVEGKVSFFATSRTLSGMADFVYLNRGTLDGVEVGSPLEVYRPGQVARESARGARVQLPDVVLAQMLVVQAEPSSSVAYVMQSRGEIELGDHFRGASAPQ